MDRTQDISPDQVNLQALIGHAQKNAYGALQSAMREVKRQRPDLSGNALYVKTIAVLGNGSFARGIDKIIKISSLSTYQADNILNNGNF